MLDKFGSEALESLRTASMALDVLVALGKYEDKQWVGEAERWAREVASVAAQLEATDLEMERTALYQPQDVTEDLTERFLVRAISEQRGVWLKVERVDGSVVEVSYEPYRLESSSKLGKYLVCYNVDHDHIEKLPLYRIRACMGMGSVFAWRESVG